MKPISLLAVLPSVLAVGACSGGGGGGSHSSPSKADAGGADAGAATAGGGDGGDDGSSSGDGNTATPYVATLSGANVVPALMTGATGAAKLALQGDGVTLSYDVTQNVASATSVNLHIGAPLESGPVTHQLTPVSSHMTGTVMLTSDEQNAIAMDQIYLDVQSQAHPGGEIRGQLTPPGATIFVANATGAQELPPVTSAYTAHASFILSGDQTTILYHVATTAVPTDVLLDRGIGGTTGTVAYPLSPIGQVVDGSLTAGSTDPQDLQAGHFYVNIVTAANQAGELRGQVIPPGATLLTGVLAGSSEVPPVTTMASGGTQFVLSADQKTIDYEAVVQGIVPIGADLDDAAKGSNGQTITTLTLDQSGALGSMNITASDVQTLLGGNGYVNVRTDSYASGELRGQLVLR